ETGEFTRKRSVVKVAATEGIPDGLTVDADGFVWCALWYGEQCVRYDLDGKPEQRISMPVRQISSVAFGGSALTDLYVTSAADSWRSELAPPGYDFNASNMGGALYRIKMDIKGIPEHQ